jgi:hypothetical protein
MPPKKKSKSKPRKTKLTTAKRTNKTTRTLVKAKATGKASKKKTAQKRKVSTGRANRKKRAAISPEKEIQREIQNDRRIASARLSGRQSGDLQNLSRTEQADSESVDELVEEGNLFEAGAISGVEEAEDADEKEVHTHEMPEDDVPEEYLDKE